MVRSHARRSGISSVDDLESESVSTGATNTTTDIISSSGDVYPPTDSGVSQAISDLNAAAKGSWIKLPAGTFATSTKWDADEQKSITGMGDSLAGTVLQPDGITSLMEVNGPHGLSRIQLDGNGVADPIIDGRTSTRANKFTWRTVEIKNPDTNASGRAYEQSAGNPFDATFFDVEFRGDTVITASPAFFDFYGCTFAGEKTRTLEFIGGWGCSFNGGTIGTGNGSGYSEQVLVRFGRGVTFNDVHFESTAATTDVIVRWGQPGDGQAPIQGGGIRDCSFVDSGANTTQTHIVVEKADGSIFKQNVHRYADTAIQANTGNPNYNNAEIGPFGTLLDVTTPATGVDVGEYDQKHKGSNVVDSGNGMRINDENRTAGVELQAETVLNGNSIQIAKEAYPNAVAVVTHKESGASSAMFVLEGSTPVVTEINDVGGSFSTTSGTSGTNVFDDGSKFVLENQTGSAKTYSVVLIG